MPMPKKKRSICRNCSNETKRASYIYCSNKCQHEYEYSMYIQLWMNGEVTGLQSLGIVSSYVKKYLRIKFGNKCCLCGWCKINTKTGKVPLVADHIDGNWRNNIEGNLRLICPNCDAISPTYAALNRGNGRDNRAPSKRAMEGRMFVSNVPK